jgi:hypothetical protein
VGDIIMPVRAVTGGLDFSNHFIPLSKSVTSPVLSEAKKQGAVIGWGLKGNARNRQRLGQLGNLREFL